MLYLIFAMLVPVVIMVPTITRAVSSVSSNYSIQRRETFLLPFEMLFYGLLVRRFEEESLWKLLLLGFFTSFWGAVIVSYYPPFS